MRARGRRIPRQQQNPPNSRPRQSVARAEGCNAHPAAPVGLHRPRRAAPCAACRRKPLAPSCCCEEPSRRAKLPRRCWSISIDGEAVCIGFATLPCGGGAPTLCTQSWGAGPFSVLRFAPAVHENAGLLYTILRCWTCDSACAAPPCVALGARRLRRRRLQTLLRCGDAWTFPLPPSRPLSLRMRCCYCSCCRAAKLTWRSYACAALTSASTVCCNRWRLSRVCACLICAIVSACATDSMCQERQCFLFWLKTWRESACAWILNRRRLSSCF